MIIKYKTLLNSIDAFRQLNSLGYMPRTALDLADISKALDNNLIPYEQERQAMEDSLRGEDGTINIAEYEAALDAIQEKEFEIDLTGFTSLKDEKFPFTTIERTNSIISPSMLLELDWFISRESEEEKPIVKKTTPKKK